MRDPRTETVDPAKADELVAIFCARAGRPVPDSFTRAEAADLLAAAGVDPPISDLDAFTIEDLLLRITRSDDRLEREFCYEALRLKLNGFEE